MALIKCPSCAAAVSDRAPACPQCGHTLAPQSKPKSQPGGTPRWLINTLIVFGVLMVIGTITPLILRKAKPPAPPVVQPEPTPEVVVAPTPSAPAQGCTRPPFELFPPGSLVPAADFERDLRTYCPDAAVERDSAILSHDGRRYRVLTTPVVEPNGLRLRRIESIRAE